MKTKKYYGDRLTSTRISMKCCMLNLETHTGILYYRFNVTKKNATDIITVQGLNYLHI